MKIARMRSVALTKPSTNDQRILRRVLAHHGMDMLSILVEPALLLSLDFLQIRTQLTDPEANDEEKEQEEEKRKEAGGVHQNHWRSCQKNQKDCRNQKSCQQKERKRGYGPLFSLLNTTLFALDGVHRTSCPRFVKMDSLLLMTTHLRCIVPKFGQPDKEVITTDFSLGINKVVDQFLTSWQQRTCGRASPSGKRHLLAHLFLTCVPFL